jgi:hypothetical protein
MFNKGSAVPAAEVCLKKLISVQETLLENIKSAKKFQKGYFNPRARDGNDYEKGEWGWLLCRNIKIRFNIIKSI